MHLIGRGNLFPLRECGIAFSQKNLSVTPHFNVAVGDSAADAN